MNSTDPWILARSNLKYFTVKLLGLKWPSHYSEWENIIENNPRGLFEAPRGSWKTYFFSLAYPLWRILRGKTEVLLVSDSEGQAEKNLRLMRETIDSKDTLAPMRPSTKELWGVDKISFPNGSLVSLMGFGTSKRGTHPDLIINDDIEGENNKMGRHDKDRMYFGVIAGMALPHTKMVTVGTPNEFGDILQQLSQNSVYKHWRKPSDLNGENQYKDIWTDEWLAFRRAEMGPLNYAREMRLERIDPATQPFKRDFETLYDVAPERSRYMLVTTVCDPAYSENDGDFTAIVTSGLTHGNHSYVLAVDRIRRDDPGIIVDKLYDHIKAWDPNSVGIKRRKGDAISFSFNERRIRENHWNFKYVEIKDTKSKTDKSRIGGLVPRWEARTIHVHKSMKDFLEEFYQFRLDDSHAYDDCLDAYADSFHPDMASPNFGKKFNPISLESKQGKSFYTVGNVSIAKKIPSAMQALYSRLDRRISDAA